MTFEQTTLNNGLRIVTASMQESQSVAVCIMAGVGSRHEDFAVNGGVSHFLEHLLFKGTKRRPSAKIIAEAIDGVGGLHNAYTTNDLTNYYIKLPKQHLNLALDILSDMVRNPLLDPLEIDRERGVVVEEMNVYRDDPARYVHDLLPQLLWPNDPLGKEVIGSEAVVQSISPEAIMNYQQAYYGPENLVVSVAGNVSHEKVVTQVQEFMGDMPRQHPVSRPRLEPGLAPELFMGFEKATNQAHVTIGCQAFAYDDALDPAARVMTTLLGSGMSSRLFLNVRERQGLAYTVFADYNNLVDTGSFSVYAGVNLDKVEQAISAIMAEFDRLRNEPVGEAELEKVKNKISGSMQMALENTSTLADRAGTRLLLLNKVKTLEETLAEVAGVTAADIQAVAQRLFEPSRLRMAVIAPETETAKNAFETLIARQV